MIKKGDKAKIHGVFHYLGNIVLACVWAYFVILYLNAIAANNSEKITLNLIIMLSLLIRNFTVMTAFLIRHRSSIFSHNFLEWATAMVGTFIGNYYVVINNRESYFLPDDIAIALNMMSLVLIVFSILSIFSLGRSFSIIPSNRGIKTSGAYSLIRHPIYSAYIFFDIIFLINNLLLRNAIVFLLSVGAIYKRSQYEEKLLMKDAKYRQYVKKVKYRFIPRLF